MATPTNLPATFVAGNVLTAAQQNDLRGAFRVLQVVEGTTSTVTSSTTSTYADTTLTATITPQSTSSKILAFANHSVCQKTVASLANRIDLRLVRSATTIGQVTSQFFTNSTVDQRGGITLIKLDSPATTSAVTYKTQFANGGNTSSVAVQVDSSLSTLILMEISA